MPNDIIIAVDPGTHDTGVFILVNNKPVQSVHLHAPRKEAVDKRIYRMLRELNLAITPYIGLLDEVTVVYEKPIYMERDQGVNPGGSTALPISQLYMFVGGLMYWAYSREYDLVGYEVGAIKEGVAGHRRAKKSSVQTVLRAEYPNVENCERSTGHGDRKDRALSDDEWDALSIAVYHMRQVAIQKATIQGDPRGGLKR